MFESVIGGGMALDGARPSYRLLGPLASTRFGAVGGRMVDQVDPWADRARDSGPVDRDDRAEDRDRAAIGRDDEARSRDAWADQRTDDARQRHESVRDELWARQVRAGAAAASSTPRSESGEGADEADLQQALLDREVAETEAEWARQQLHELLDEARTQRDEATQQRRASARDRAAGGVDRDEAAADRREAAADRDQAEIDANRASYAKEV